MFLVIKESHIKRFTNTLCYNDTDGDWYLYDVNHQTTGAFIKRYVT